MKLPSDLSGHALVDAFCRHWGYVKLNQAGSHIVVQTQEPTPHRVSIPALAAKLAIEDTAEALAISSATVKRDWATAKLWLHQELEPR